jgi:hypothetical protein
MNKKTKQNIINAVCDKVYQGAVSMVYDGAAPDMVVAHVHNEYPFIKEDNLWLGLQKYWIEVVQSRLS